MNANIMNSLMITVLGMGLVFAAILLLWGIMAVLVRLNPEKSTTDPVVATDDLAQPKPDVLLPAANLDLKRKAALVAVAYAIAHDKDSLSPHEFPLPPTAVVSAWQVVMRSKMLNKRGSVR